MNFFQTVFTVFYAIVWGMVANVQPRWKAFDFPYFLADERTWYRVWLSFWWLNVFPVVFFVISLVSFDSPIWADDCLRAFPKAFMAVFSVLPAFAVFGFYRLWLSIIEGNTERYYWRVFRGPTRVFVPNPNAVDAVDLEINDTRRLQNSRANRFFAVAYVFVGAVPFLMTLGRYIYHVCA